MEAVLKALAGNNGWLVALLIIIIVAMLIIGAKSGLVNIRTNKLSVGKLASDIERTIMRNQIEFSKIACYAFEQKIPKYEGYNEYRGKYVLEMVLDEVIKWIAFNHIEDTQSYIRLKQDLIWNMVQGYIEHDIYMSKRFRKGVDDDVEYIIKNLVKIRKEYETRWK